MCAAEAPESSELSQTWLSERSRGHKDIEHLHGTDEVAGLCEIGLPESSELSQTWLSERRRGHKDIELPSGSIKITYVLVS